MLFQSERAAAEAGGETRGPAAEEESSYELGKETVRPPLSCVPGHPTYPELLLLGTGEGVGRGGGGVTGGAVVVVVVVVALVCVPPLTTALELKSDASRAIRVLLLLTAGGGVSTVDFVLRVEVCAFFQRRARCAKAELLLVAWLTTERCSSFFSSCIKKRSS